RGFSAESRSSARNPIRVAARFSSDRISRDLHAGCYLRAGEVTTKRQRGRNTKSTRRGTKLNLLCLLCFLCSSPFCVSVVNEERSMQPPLSSRAFELA